jgi:catechol 2,3-dioxygenase-like lactoylglutathione lyase family enzyme
MPAQETDMMRVAAATKLATALALAATPVLTLAAPAYAQLGERNQLGVRMGHMHLLVRDVRAHKHFWIEQVGARLVKNGPLELVELPGIYVMLTEAPDPPVPAGAFVDHFGFSVKDFAASVARWKAAGIAMQPTENPNELYLLAPDGVRVEVYGEPSLPQPMAMTHVHYYPQEATVAAVQAWYVKVLGANPSWRPCVACLSRPRMYQTADIGPVNLTLTPSEQARLATRGRAIDHVGFDVANLDAFVRHLEAAGVSLEGAVRTVPGTNVKIAFLTDPWGARIELTEGLAP